MGANRTPPGHDPHETAQTATEVIELLEVLWERGKDAASTAPVSASQLRVMHCIDRDEGINLRTLGEALGAASSSVSRLCDRLEALGFVERLPSPTSRRELELHLTGHGKAYLRRLRSQREDALLAVLSSMRPRDREALLKGLRSFRGAVDASLPKSRPASGDSAVRPA
ncbi:MarR family winged helix-turn-helix transcriptional regulator [Streptomyces sp. NPDC054796]